MASTALIPPAATTSTPSTPSPTGFLSLPLEIRFIVYAHLLCIPPYTRPLISSSAYYYYHILGGSSSSSSKVHTGILLANRRIHAEASQFLYSNIFIAHPTLLSSFPRLRACYPPLREAKALVPLIRRFHIQVRLDCDVPYDTQTVAEAFSGLDELSVDVVQSSFMGVGYQNLTKFEAVRGVRQVYVGGSTTGFEDYVQWLVAAMQSPLGAHVPSYEPSDESPWMQVWGMNTHHVLISA